jgi:hypothetical protein
LPDKNWDTDSWFSTFGEVFASLMIFALKKKHTGAYALAIRQGFEVDITHLEKVLAK